MYFLTWNLSAAGADLGFSRVGADFQKKFSENFVELFLGRPKWFFELSLKHSLAPVLAKFSAPQAKFWKNSPKKHF